MIGYQWLRKSHSEAELMAQLPGPPAFARFASYGAASQTPCQGEASEGGARGSATGIELAPTYANVTCSVGSEFDPAIS
jgi:hypothetical protein